MLLSPSSRKHDLPLLMGIVNVTGDSFSEGGLSAPETAVERALQLLADGADILDIGGESTRPGAEDVTGKVEISRLSPVISEILRQAPDAVISVDTRRAGTAGEMLGLGAKIINDVSMLRFDPEMPEVLRENPESILVLCHSRGTPQNMRFPAAMTVTLLKSSAMSCLRRRKNQVSAVNGYGSIPVLGSLKPLNSKLL